MATPVSVMSNSEKVKEAILRSKRFMPVHLAYQVEAFLTPENLALMTGTVVILGRLALLRGR